MAMYVAKQKGYNPYAYAPASQLPHTLLTKKRSHTREARAKEHKRISMPLKGKRKRKVLETPCLKLAGGLRWVRE